MEQQGKRSGSVSPRSYINPQEPPMENKSHKHVSPLKQYFTRDDATSSSTKRIRFICDKDRPLTIHVSLRFIILSLGTVSAIALVTGVSLSQIYYHLHMKKVMSTIQSDGIMQRPAINLLQNNTYTGAYLLSSPQQSPTLNIAIDDNNINNENDSSSQYQPLTNADDIEYVAGSGHHIFAKIRNVDSTFLSSPKRLMTALRRVISKSQIEPLSIHCTSTRRGVNCIALLKEGSHVTVQTWITGSSSSSNNVTKNNGGTLTFDFLSSGLQQAKLLEMTLPTIETEFSVSIPSHYLTPAERSDPYLGKPIFRWGQRQRQTQDDPGHAEGNKNPFWEDLGEYLTTVDDMKEKIVSITSPFQRVDVWEFVDSKRTRQESYLASLRDDVDTYESRHPELFAAEIDVYLDGVLQSNSKGNEAYHEALVQPAMFTHPSPRRVAIIGGGEGATLREVLKHNTLEKVVMIDIDEIMVKESAKHLYPWWNGCDDFIVEGGKRVSSCFDDDRADVRFEDALAWFIDRFYEGDDDEYDGKEDKDEDVIKYDDDEFDVIIMDALDPHDDVEFAKTLYNNDVFFKSLYSGLEEDGILVAQLGESNHAEDPAEENTENANRAAVLRLLKEVGFQSVFMYEETHCGFEWPWEIAIACKSITCRSRWLSNPAQIDKLIHERILRSYSGTPLLKNFDGATMAFYQAPTHSDEAVYCRKEPTPEECVLGQGYNVDWKAFGDDSLEVVIDEESGVGVVAKVDIPAMSYIHTGRLIHFSRQMLDTMDRVAMINADLGHVLEPLQSFMKQRSQNDSLNIEDGIFTPSSLASLMQYGQPTSTHPNNSTTANVAPLGTFLSSQHPEKATAGYEIIYNTMSALISRRLSSISAGYLLSLRHIHVGERLFIAPVV